MVQDEGPCQLLSYIAVIDMIGFIAIEFLRNIPGFFKNFSYMILHLSFKKGMIVI
jgi:hypothetical protein